MRPRLTHGEEATKQDIDEMIHGFSVTRVGSDGQWDRVDPERLVEYEPRDHNHERGPVLGRGGG